MWATWWQLLHSVVTAWKHLENMQSNRCGYVSIKFYFRALKFGFHIIFYMLHNLLLNLFQPFKNAKTFLAHGLHKNRRWARFCLRAVICWPKFPLSKSWLSSSWSFGLGLELSPFDRDFRMFVAKVIRVSTSKML